MINVGLAKLHETCGLCDSKPGQITNSVTGTLSGQLMRDEADYV